MASSSATNHPITVQPRKIFNSRMAVELCVCRMAARIAGRKYSPITNNKKCISARLPPSASKLYAKSTPAVPIRGRFSPAILLQSRHMPTRVRSHAKINLGLGIGAPRPDGFHGLATVYQTLEIFDEVTVAALPAAKTTIRLTSNHPGVPTDSRNTAWKMISLALDELEIRAEVSIHIEKLLPVQGGLGAGSANAVAALVGLERELRISEPSAKPNWPARRLAIAAQVGSDVPLFLIGGAVLGLDRGQKVCALPDLEPLWC